MQTYRLLTQLIKTFILYHIVTTQHLATVKPVYFLDKTPFGTITKCVNYAGVLVFKCPD